MLNYVNTQESYRKKHCAVNKTMNDAIYEQARQAINHLNW